LHKAKDYNAKLSAIIRAFGNKDVFKILASESKCINIFILFIRKTLI